MANREILAGLVQSGAGILLAKLLTIGLTFVFIPLAIHRLGLAIYGAWETYLAAGAIANILGSVISGVLIWLVSQAYGRNDSKQVEVYTQCAVFIWIIMTGATIACSVLFGGKLAALFGLSEIEGGNIVWGIQLAVAIFAVSSLNELLSASVSGQQRAGSAHLIQGFGAVVGTATSIALLLWYPRLESVFIGYSLGLLFSLSGLVILLRTMVPGFSLRPKIPPLQLLTNVRRYAAFIVLGVVATVLRDQTDRLLLAASGATVAVANYGIASRLAGIIMILCTFFYTPAVAAAGRLYGEGRRDDLDKLYLELSRVTLVIVGVATVVMAGLSDWIFRAWLGQVYLQAQNLLYWLLFANATVVVLTATGTAIGKGVGLVRPETLYIIIGLALNIVLKLALFPIIGGEGAVMASSLSWAISALIFLWLFHKDSGIGAASVIHRLLACSLVVLLGVLVTKLLASVAPNANNRMETIMQLAVLVFTSSVVTLFLMFLAKLISINDIKLVMTYQKRPAS